MSNSEAVLVLTLMASTLLCLPYLMFRVLPCLVKLARVYWFPPKFIDVEIIDGDKVIKERIDLKDIDALENKLQPNKEH